MHSATHTKEMYPVSAEVGAGGEWTTPGLDYSDYSRMYTHTHKLDCHRKLAAPEWATNDKLLQQLLVVYLERRARLKPGTGTIPERLARAQAAIKAEEPMLTKRLDVICQRYVELKRQPDTGKKRLRELEIEIEGIDSQIIAARQHGFADKVLGVVHCYYRQGLSSPETAAHLKMKPPSVRVTLQRLRDSWEWMQTGKVTPRGKQRVQIDIERAKQLYAQGKTLREINLVLGRKTTKWYTLHRALKDAGVVTRKPVVRNYGVRPYKPRMPYADAITTLRFKNRLAKSLKKNPKPSCHKGHDLINPTAGHIGVSTLMRTGRIRCRTCWNKIEEARKERTQAARNAG